MSNIECRLQVLEKSVHRSRQVNLILAVALVAIVCIAATQGTTQQTAVPANQKDQSPEANSQNGNNLPGKDRLRTIEADRFVLLDRHGRARAKMEMTDSGPTISMFDEKGRKKLELSQTANASGLRLFDSDETPVVSLQLPYNKADRARLEITSTQGSSLTRASGFSVRDNADNGRLHLLLINGNFPTLGISQSGQNGPPSIEMTAGEDGSRAMKIHNNDGYPLFSVFASRSGNTFINMRHPSHERSLQISSGPNDHDGPRMLFFAPTNKDGSGGLLPFLQFGLQKDRQPFIRTIDSDGRTVFSAPTK